MLYKTTTTFLFLLLFSTLFFHLNTYAQRWDWAKKGGGSSSDGGYGIAVDGAGNTYVTGYFEGTASFGGTSLTSSGGKDVFVAKYDTSGNLLWAKKGGGTDWDEGYGIAVDSAGNTYVTGYFEGTASFGGTSLTSSGSNDVFVAKYDASGNVLWEKKAGGTNFDKGRGIAVDGSGNAYVTGEFSGTASFGGTTLSSSGTYIADIFVAKYDASGNVLWAKKAGGSSWDEGRSIAVDGSGNTYVTGYFLGTANFGGTTLTSSGSNDVFVAKYDASGNVLWAKKGGGSSLDGGSGIAVDGSGNAYVTGEFSGTASFGGTTLSSSGGSDIFVAKYDASGAVLWAKKAWGTSDDLGFGIAVDGSGNTYVSGFFEGTASFGGTTLSSSGSRDIFIAKYDASGSVLWAKKAGGTSDDEGEGIAVDGAGNTYVTGYFEGTASFGGDTLISSGSRDIFIAKLVQCPTINTTISQTICTGDSYTVGTSTYTTSGTYTDVLKDVNGCDSTVTLNLTVNDTNFVQVNDSVKQGEPFQGTVYANDTVLYRYLAKPSRLRLGGGNFFADYTCYKHCQ